MSSSIAMSNRASYLIIRKLNNFFVLTKTNQGESEKLSRNRWRKSNEPFVHRLCFTPLNSKSAFFINMHSHLGTMFATFIQPRLLMCNLET